MNTINILRDVVNIDKFENLPRLKMRIMATIYNIVSIIREKIEGAGDTFVNVMMKVSIIKLAVTMIALMIMAVLFFAHLHVFTPITLQFSKWISSPIIGFVVTIIIIKFVGISIGLTLTILTVKNMNITDARLKVIEWCRLRSGFLLKKKVQPQINFLTK